MGGKVERMLANFEQHQLACRREKGRFLCAVAAALADVVMITTDNPRREDPAAIADQIAEGCTSVGDANWQIELDRERAFDEVLRASAPGDTVLLAGKGHETYQEINDLVQPFDDRAMARSILTALKETR